MQHSGPIPICIVHESAVFDWEYFAHSSHLVNYLNYYSQIHTLKILSLWMFDLIRSLVLVFVRFISIFLNFSMYFHFYCLKGQSVRYACLIVLYRELLILKSSYVFLIISCNRKQCPLIRRSVVNALQCIEFMICSNPHQTSNIYCFDFVTMYYLMRLCNRLICRNICRKVHSDKQNNVLSFPWTRTTSFSKLCHSQASHGRRDQITIIVL